MKASNQAIIETEDWLKIWQINQSQQRQIDELVRIIKRLTGNYGIDHEEIQKSLDYIRQLKDGYIE